MGAGLLVTIAPLSLPVTRNAAKEWLNIHSSVTVDDTLVDELLALATRLVEDLINGPILNTAYTWTLDDWPRRGIFKVPRGPLVSVSNITYLADGTTDHTTYSTVAGTAYHADLSRSVIMFDEDFDPPDLAAGEAAPVKVTFVAGYGLAAAVPPPLTSAVKILVAHHYTYRGVITGAAEEVHASVSALVAPYTKHYGTLDNLADSQAAIAQGIF